MSHIPLPNRGRRAFTEQEAAQIRQLYAQGLSQAAIARYMRVNPQTIGRLLRGETYINAAPHDVRATVAEQNRQPDLNAPNASMELARRIMAATPSQAVMDMIDPPMPRQAETLESARAYKRIMGEWPEGYTPPAEASEDQLEV